LQAIIHRRLLAGLISLLLGPATYAVVLNTTYLRGFVISILFVLIAVMFFLLLVPMMGFHYMDNVHWTHGEIV